MPFSAIKRIERLTSSPNTVLMLQFMHALRACILAGIRALHLHLGRCILNPGP